MPNRKRIAILISGRGSNMVNLLDACSNGSIYGRPVVVISNKAKAAGLQKAAERGVETLVMRHRDYDSREDYDKALVQELRSRDVDLICLAGFMRLLSPVFIHAFVNRIMNIHPSLLPAFPGLDAQEQAFDYGVKVSGATVHFVDEHLDNGPIILQKAVDISDCTSREEVSDRILAIEHELYPQAVAMFCDDRLDVDFRRVNIKPIN